MRAILLFATVYATVAFAAPALATESGPAAPALGATLTVGGGVQTFMGEGMRDIADTAFTWTVRLAVGTRVPLALEVAYLGSRQSVEPADMGEAAVLVSHGFQGDVRFNLDPGPVQPFLFVGVAMRRYQVTGVAVNRSSMANSDSVVELPFGAGAAFRAGALSIEARAAYHDALDEDLLPGLANQTNGLDTWELGLAVGWEL